MALFCVGVVCLSVSMPPTYTLPSEHLPSRAIIHVYCMLAQLTLFMYANHPSNHLASFPSPPFSSAIATDGPFQERVLIPRVWHSAEAKPDNDSDGEEDRHTMTHSNSGSKSK